MITTFFNIILHGAKSHRSALSSLQTDQGRVHQLYQSNSPRDATDPFTGSGNHETASGSGTGHHAATIRAAATTAGLTCVLVIVGDGDGHISIPFCFGARNRRH